MKHITNFDTIQEGLADYGIPAPQLVKMDNLSLYTKQGVRTDDLLVVKQIGNEYELIEKYPRPANNIIYYRTTLNEAVYPNENSLLGADNKVLTVTSNTYNNDLDCWQMVLSDDLINIGQNAFYKACGFTWVGLPDSCECIGYRGFRQCSSNWMHITFGSGIKRIESQAFHAIQLEDFEIPTSLEYINDSCWYTGFYDYDYKSKRLKPANIILPAGISYYRVFCNAWGLNSIIFAEGHTVIPGTMFSGTTDEYCDVKHIHLPESATSIADAGFIRAGHLIDINIPSSITAFPQYCFAYCYDLQKVNIPNRFTTIPYACFYMCSSLRKLDLPDSITSIAGWAFQSCTSLEDINIPNNIQSIDYAAFDSCNLKNIHIPTSLTSIGDWVFTGNPNVQSITVDQNNTKYDSRNNCQAIIETSTNKLIYGHIDLTTIPEGIVTIGEGAFSVYAETENNTIEIPSTVTLIDDCAFGDIPSLTTVICKATTPPTLHADAFSNSINITNVYVPADSVDAYKAATNWSTFGNKISAIQ